MSRGPFDPAFNELPASLPIFPLSGVLLLPGGRLPLNIFEPRYLEMFDDALAGERLIGMIQPTESERSGDPPPATYRTGCAGRISAFSETDDGRYLVTLTGLIRFDVAEELPAVGSYRRVRPDYGRFPEDLECAAEGIEREPLLEALRLYFSAHSLESDWSAIEDADDEPLVTSLAMVCPLEPSEKQMLLEAGTLRERAETLRAILELSVHAAGQEDGGEGRAH